MKKHIPTIFMAAVTALCLVPFIGMLISPSAALANEIQSPRPELFREEGGINSGFLSDCVKYTSDHFALRHEMITARNRILSLFGASGEDSVTVGRGGWLYFASTNGDYTGSERMTAREIYSAAKNLALMQEFCDEEGMGFLFTAAPNKNSVYPENMPSLGAVSGGHDVKRLYARLGEMGVNYLDLESVITGESGTLYYAHDSHWNERGAALGADAINGALGHPTDFYNGEFAADGTHDGDLFEMIYPAGRDTEPMYKYSGELNYTHNTDTPVRPDSFTIETGGAGEKNLLCYRDSFGNSLYPYLAASHGFSRFSRATTYNLMTAEQIEADEVVIEVVERNLGNLIAYAPFMPSPVREIMPQWSLPYSVEITTDTDRIAPVGGKYLEGTLETVADGETVAVAADDDSPVYIVGADYAVEAFLLSDNRFAAYVPYDFEPESAAFFHGGELYIMPAE